MSLQGNATADVVLRGKINSLNTLVVDAYDIAVKNGFDGTEEEWLASLKGEKGDTGAKGDRGEKGETGGQGIQGVQGVPGYTPIKGVDYYTEAERGAFKTEVLGDIDTALDGILAIQTELIGGDGA